MFRVTEFDHPEHNTYKWTKLECEWINERIRLAMHAECEACAIVCEDGMDMSPEAETSEWMRAYNWACRTRAGAIRNRYNDALRGRASAACEGPLEGTVMPQKD